jgi:hypothetical protein
MKKSIFLLLTFCCLTSNAATVGILPSIYDIHGDGYQKFYNASSFVVPADKQRQAQPHFDEFLSKAKEAVQDSGLEDVLGFRLIHRHFPLADGCVMVEEVGEHKGDLALITSAQPIGDAKEKNARAASWAISGGDLVPFEFSRDPAVEAGLELVMAQTGIIDSLKALIEHYKFEDLLALSILKREGLGSNPEEIPYGETSFGGKSVVTLRYPDSERIITTAWTLGEEKKHGCHPYCTYWCQSDLTTGYSHEGHHDNAHG